MATVGQLLESKNGELLNVSPDATVLAAAEKMNDHRVGALLVVVDGIIEGIFTERDILRRVVAEQRPPDTTTVGQVMTRDLFCCTADTPIAQAKMVFREKRIRHLPVVEGSGRPIGLISIGDVNAWAMDNQSVEISYLHEYLYGTRTRGSGGY